METIRHFFGSRPTSADLVDCVDFANDLVYPVHLHDANFAPVLMVCTLRFDSLLDPQKLSSALTRLLEIGDWKKLGGRLRRNINGKLEIHVPELYSAKRPAVIFSHNNLSKIAIGDHNLAGKLPIPTCGLSIQPNAYNLIELGINDNIPKSIDEMIGCDRPQLSAHVVSFQNATLVSISWPHSVMGSMGFRHFCHSWSLVLSGRENEVPEFLGANKDVLLEIEIGEPSSTREELLIQKKRLTGLGLGFFFLRLVWSMRTPRDVKSIFIPKRALAQLQADCRKEIAEAPSSQSIPLPSEEVTLLAWFARLVSSGSSSDRPVTIFSMLNVMQAASSMFNQAGIHAHNMTMYAMSFLPCQIARGGLGPLTQQHTRQVQEQSTQKQCLSFLRMYRQTTRGTPFKPLYGPSNAHPVVYNDLGKVNLIHSVDFRAALVEKLETVGDRPRGAMTCYYYHIINNQLGAGLDCIYLLGKDHGENLWVTAALPASTWARVEAALKDYQ